MKLWLIIISPGGWAGTDIYDDTAGMRALRSDLLHRQSETSKIGRLLHYKINRVEELEDGLI